MHVMVYCVYLKKLCASRHFTSVTYQYINDVFKTTLISRSYPDVINNLNKRRKRRAYFGTLNIIIIIIIIMIMIMKIGRAHV